MNTFPNLSALLNRESICCVVMIILPCLSSLRVSETIHKQTYRFFFFQLLLSLSIKNLLSLKCQMLAHIFCYISEQYVLK